MVAELIEMVPVRAKGFAAGGGQLNVGAGFLALERLGDLDEVGVFQLWQGGW